MGAGFAWMAWKLAISRVYPEPTPSAENFSPERMTKRCSGAAEYCEHCEYYNIIDNATRSEGAMRAARRLGMLPEGGLRVTL